jgi:hypothetical protein
VLVPEEYEEDSEVAPCASKFPCSGVAALNKDARLWLSRTRFPDVQAQGIGVEANLSVESATGDEYHSPVLLALGFGEAAPPVHRRKRKRRRVKRRQGAAMQHLSPTYVSSDDVVALTALEEITMVEQKYDQQVRPLFSPFCVLEFSVEMAHEDATLQKALFVTIVGTRPEVLGAEIINEVARSFNIDVGAMSIHQEMPEDFILFLPDERTTSRVFNDGSIFSGP